MDAQGIIALRKQAANNIGITWVSVLPPRRFDGTAGDYGQLSAADQIKVGDEMARLIANDPDPSKYTVIQLDLARRRIGSTMYGQPLQATSYIAVTGELIRTGQFQDLLLKSASNYITSLTTTTVVAAVVVIGVLWQINQGKLGRSRS